MPKKTVKSLLKTLKTYAVDAHPQNSAQNLQAVKVIQATALITQKTRLFAATVTLI